jgi:hypothetical protein
MDMKQEEYEEKIKVEINKMHDDGLFNVFNDGKKIIMNDDTFIKLVGYKVNFNELVSNIQGAIK